MIRMVQMIQDGPPASAGVKVVIYLTERIPKGTGAETERGRRKGLGTETVIGIGIDIGTGTRKEKGRGAGIGIEIRGMIMREIVKGIETGGMIMTDIGEGIETGDMIMIEVQEKEAEETMKGAGAGVGVEATAEVCMIKGPVLINSELHLEMKARKRRLHLAILPSLKIYMVT